MHNRRGYLALRLLTRGYVTVVLLVAAAAQMVLFENSGNVHVIFGLLVAAAVPACLTGPRWLRRVLSSRLMIYIGTRSYALYLVHRLSKGVIDRLIAPGGTVIDQLLRLPLITALGLLGAEMLRMLVEQPMIRLGRRLTSRDRSGRPSTELESTVDRPEHPIAAVAERNPLKVKAKTDPVAATAESTGDPRGERADSAQRGVPGTEHGSTHWSPSGPGS
jgi:peptidoglycan/LPS O-acetylase OafA/YrhL